jgi:hypothetical protein
LIRFARDFRVGRNSQPANVAGEQETPPRNSNQGDKKMKLLETWQIREALEYAGQVAGPTVNGTPEPRS